MAVGGCNYVHFGRLKNAPSDAALATDNADLRIEKKLLQQELAIARKEGDALRAALDRPATVAPGSEELVAKLNETTRQLASLRADYTRLQARREQLSSEKPTDNMAAAEQIADLKNQLGQTEEKLATTMASFTELQKDNSRLRTAIDAAHEENTALTTKFERVTSQNNEARAALAQLNTELLAQQDSRAKAEQSAEALRAQLHAMAAQSQPDAPTTLASARESSASGAREIDSTLKVDQAPAGPTTTATLSTNAARLRATAAASEPAPAPENEPASPALKPIRTYVVREGDTLEKIAAQFYGRPERWSLLYTANNALLSGGRPLKPGMELQIPEQ
jgi:nucleoid-associated protein YgaU